MKTKMEILAELGITPETKHHEYGYLYSRVILAMQLYAEQECSKSAEKENTDLLMRLLFSQVKQTKINSKEVLPNTWTVKRKEND